MSHKPGSGAIFGLVSEEGVAKVGSPVYLLDMQRDLGLGKGKILARQFTANDGGFVFNGLDPTYTDYAVIATDEDGVAPKNALIQDRIQPSPAHQGATLATNWWIAAHRHGAAGVISGWPLMGTNEYPNIPGTNNGVQDYKQVINGDAAACQFLLTINPGAPNLPAWQISSDSALGVLCSVHDISQGVTANEASLEWVLDFSSVEAGRPCVALAGSKHLNSTPSGSLIPPQAWHGSWLLLYLEAGVLKLRVSGAEVNYGHTNLFNTTQILSYDARALTGVHHIVTTFRHNGLCELFIDGVSVASVLTTNNIDAVIGARGSRLTLFLLVGGQNGDGSTDAHPTGARFKTGVAAAYLRALSSTEIQQHYKLLMTTSELPIASGFERAVLERQPRWYYRLNEATVDDVNPVWDALSTHGLYGGYNTGKLYKNLFLSAATGATPLQSSPVMGGNAVLFNGSAYLVNKDAGVYQHISPYYASFSAWVKFTDTTPTTVEKIAVQFFPKNMDEVNGVMFSVRRNTSGKIEVLSRRGGTNYTDVFANYTPPANTWLLLFVRVDLSNPTTPTMELWVGTETVAPELKSSISVAAARLSNPYDNPLFGDYRDIYSRLEIGRNFRGALCEVALYPQKLTNDDMQALWEAKDTP